jgi:hypothetical protein
MIGREAKKSVGTGKEIPTSASSQDIKIAVE